jgi:K+-transporting ATPase ATPase C chain
MPTHLSANLRLLAMTLILCCVLYPLVLWLIGQTPFFRSQAEGSILAGKGNQPAGSRLIAQPFKGDEYFWPRPSAANYNAAASTGSNLGASNYLLRDRVARTLGPIVKYRDGRPVAPDIERWFAKNANLVAEWASRHPDVAKAWVNADPEHAKLVDGWKESHPQEFAAWRKKNPDQPKPAAADLVEPFFLSYAKQHRARWPKGSGDPLWSVPAVFFDRWLQDHPEAELQPVPADMVTTSGSGLDPHITLKNAHYQLDRVAAAWEKKIKVNSALLRKVIEKLLREMQEAPFAGWVGVPLVNVLELNVAVSDRMAHLAKLNGP